MDSRLRRIINKIEDRSLRGKIVDMIEKSSIEIDGRRYEGLPLEIAPGSTFHHHDYLGGLLEHVLSSSKIASVLCDCVEEIYHGKVDRDIIFAGVILHDLYKTLTYEERVDGRYGFTPLAERVDHLSLIISEMTRRGFPLDLIHAVYAHHGATGPMRPKTVEALILHLADLADSQLNGEVIKAAKYLVKEATGEMLEKITAKEAFEILHLKKVGGWDHLRRTLGKRRED
mgnify:CR=1 FL=1